MFLKKRMGAVRVREWGWGWLGTGDADGVGLAHGDGFWLMFAFCLLVRWWMFSGILLETVMNV